MLRYYSDSYIIVTCRQENFLSFLGGANNMLTVSTVEGVRPHQNLALCLWHKDTSDKGAQVLEIWGPLSTLSLPLLLASLCPGVVVPVRVPYMAQIDLFQTF